MYQIILMFCMLTSSLLSVDSEQYFENIDVKELENVYYSIITEGLDSYDRTQRSAVEEATTSTEAPVKQCKPHFTGPPNRCCTDGHQHSEEFKSFKKECFAAVKDQLKPKKNETNEPELTKFSCEKHDKIKSSVVCAMECMSKKQDVLDENGMPDVDKVKSTIKKQFSEDAWQLKIIDDVIDHCMAEVASKMILEAQKQEETPVPKCNQNPAVMAHCMWKQLFVKCPTEMQEQSTECLRTREKFEKLKEQDGKLEKN